MERTELLELWGDMWKEGNWVPSWPDSLADLGAKDAARSPDASCHSIWQEVAHVIFWRRVTLARMAGGDPPDGETVERLQFAAPSEATEDAWAAEIESLKRTQDEIAAAIADESKDISRIPYHLIHDAYHLGRITQIRGIQGIQPKF